MYESAPVRRCGATSAQSISCPPLKNPTSTDAEQEVNAGLFARPLRVSLRRPLPVI